MQLIVYGDFNCPYSCLAAYRADRLVARGLVALEWRAVEHDPSIPAPSAPAEGELASMLDREVDEIRGLVRADEELPIRRPPVQPNTAGAVRAYAGADAGVRDELRRLLFAALWFDGRDIGDPAVLEELGAAAVVDSPPLVAAWRDAWQALERPIVPMAVLPDGYVSRGLGALARLADLAADR